MGKKKSTLDPEQVAEEARSSFGLSERLAGITKRTRTVTAYTDEIAGEALGGVETIYMPGTELVTGTRRWGVAGEQADLRDEIKTLLAGEEVDEEQVASAKKRAAALERKAKALRKTLEETALTFTLRAVPELVMKDSRRKAYRHLKLKSKGGLTDEQREDLGLEYLARVLSKMVVEWSDASTGEKHEYLPLEDARALQAHLLPEEWGKIETTIDELQARKAIGDAATADADF